MADIDFVDLAYWAVLVLAVVLAAGSAEQLLDSLRRRELPERIRKGTSLEARAQYAEASLAQASSRLALLFLLIEIAVAVGAGRLLQESLRAPEVIATVASIIFGISLLMAIWARRHPRLRGIMAIWALPSAGQLREAETSLREAIALADQIAQRERSERERAERERARAEREVEGTVGEWLEDAERLEVCQRQLSERTQALQEAEETIAILNSRLSPELRIPPEGEGARQSEVFLEQIHRCYGARYGDSERAEYPLREIQIGWRFFESLEKLQGVSDDKLLEVICEVASRRAFNSSGRDAHRLRSNAAGSSEGRVRSRDGAKAWRCALKRNAPAAPRLHWWELPGGGVELAWVGNHDDFTCPE